MAMVPPALTGQGGGGKVDMKITGQSERGQLGGGQALPPSSTPPSFHKAVDKHPCLGGSHSTPPSSLATPCSGLWGGDRAAGCQTAILSNCTRGKQ